MYETLDWLWRLAAAELLFVAWGYAAFAVATRLLPTSGAALRWTAAGVTGMWLLSVAFHGLLPFSAFTLPWALALALGTALATVVAWGGAPLRCAVADLGRLRDAGSAGVTGRASRFAILGAVGAALAVAVRAALVPVVGWDSLTYHAVKAALWVQSGGPIGLEAAGGFNIYRNYPGGGEVLHAWAMLPMRSDVLAGCVDGLTWLGLGLAVHALGAQFDLSRTARWTAAAYVLAVPAVARAAGSLYVDNTLALCLIAACALALHALRHKTRGALLLACMALGVGIGVKIFALPVAAAALCAWIIAAFSRRDAGWIVAEVTAGSAAMLAAAAPWFVGNWLRTGFPMSPIPLQIGGIKLGEPSAAMLWYLDRPAAVGAGLLDELQALLKTFGVPGFTPLDEPTLGIASLLVILLAAISLARLFVRDWRSSLVTAAFIGPMIASFYGAGLKNTRLIWASVSGRYLLAMLGICVILSFACCRRRGAWQTWYGRLLWVATLLYLVVSDVAGWTALETATSIGVAAVTLVGVVLWTRSPPPRAANGVSALLLVQVFLILASPAMLLGYREATREHSLRNSIALHASPRYWIPALVEADQPARPRTIAVTGGANQDSDNWLLYPFLGKRFQNELIYVPVTASGALIDLANNEQRVAAADYSAWQARLAESGVHQVMSFAPQSLELFWMERDSAAFTRLAGDGRRWGLYQVVADASAN